MKQSPNNSDRDARLAPILRNINTEKEKYLDYKKCSVKIDTGSISEAFVQILATNVQVEVSASEMSDEERIRRLAAQSQENRLIIQPIIPNINVEEVKQNELKQGEPNKERKYSQRGIPEGSIIMIKTVEEEPNLGIQLSTHALTATIHKRMQGIIGKKNLSVDGVVNIKKVGQLYSLRYKIQVLEGWQGPLQKVEDIMKEAKFVKECTGTQQKAGEGCTIF